ncbi:MAG: 30S ribosomal protein S15 [archaeon]
MHGKSKGKSGSKKPAKKTSPEWVESKPDEIKEKIIELAQKGHTSSEIGLILRDVYAVPSVKQATKQKIEKIISQVPELKQDFPRDLLNLITKSVKEKKHFEKNRHDKTAQRGYQLTVSKIRRLLKYYSKKNRVPKGWRYTEENAALMVK